MSEIIENNAVTDVDDTATSPVEPTTSKAANTSKAATSAPEPAATFSNSVIVSATKSAASGAASAVSSKAATTKAATAKAPTNTIESLTYNGISTDIPLISASDDISSGLPVATESAATSNSSPSSSGMIPGIVGGVLAAAIIAAFAFVFIRRSRRRAVKNSRVSRTMDEMFSPYGVANNYNSSPPANENYDIYRKNTVATRGMVGVAHENWDMNQGYQYQDYQQNMAAPGVYYDQPYQDQNQMFPPQAALRQDNGNYYDPQAQLYQDPNQQMYQDYSQQVYQDPNQATAYQASPQQHQQYAVTSPVVVNATGDQPYRLDVDLGANQNNGAFIGNNDYTNAANYQKHQSPNHH